MDLKLIEMLMDAGGEPVGVDFLVHTLGVDLGTLDSRIVELKAAGYVVEAAHLHGSAAWRLLELPDRLLPHEVRRRLETDWVGCRVECVERCSSTNDRARDLIREGAPSGTMVLAEEQTAGRGRLGRRWHSERGKGLYLSLVIRPPGPFDAPGLLQLASAVAVAHAAMKRTGRPARIRWPNDVLMDDRKVSGILVEAIGARTGSPVFVVGIGLNVNHCTDDFPEDLSETATSLRVVKGRALDRLAVLATLLNSIEEWYDRMFAGDTVAVGEAWRSLSSLLGKNVILHQGPDLHRGVVTDLSPLEGLRLRAADGSETWVPAEQVTRIRPAE